MSYGKEKGCTGVATPEYTTSLSIGAQYIQGVGTAEDIDRGMKLGTNQPMGPLQLADFIGTDVLAPTSSVNVTLIRVAATGSTARLWLAVCASSQGFRSLHVLLPCCAHNPDNRLITPCPSLLACLPHSQVRGRCAGVVSARLEAAVQCVTLEQMLVGLDTCLSIMRVLHSGTGDSKYRPCPLLVQHVDAGTSLFQQCSALLPGPQWLSRSFERNAAAENIEVKG